MATQTASSRRRNSSPAVLWLRYGGVCLLVIGALIVLRAALVWVAESFVYTLPMLGGLFKTLELMEMANVFIFALLGISLGALTRWLPRRTPLATGTIALVIAVPLVFLSGYSVRHSLWVQQVAAQSELSPAQSQQVTDRLLLEATGQTGLLGFFRYTVQVPILPTDLSALQSIEDEDKWFRSELTRYSGLEPGLFTLIFRTTGWGIRIFYALLSLVTAVIYYTKGIVWADTTPPTRSHASSEGG